MAHSVYFHPELFSFFKELARHNERDWFLAHRERYETFVRRPALAFSAALDQRLQRFAPDLADGKLMRIHRDIRFSANKSPYKTNLAVMFRSSEAGDGPSPGFYLHLAPGEVFVGGGLWSPDTATQNRVRTAIVEHPRDWQTATRRKGFPGLSTRHDDDSLKRPPRGFDPNHELVEDLKRRHFIATTRFTEKAATRPDFLDAVEKACRSTNPLVKFLNAALGLG